MKRFTGVGLMLCLLHAAEADPFQSGHYYDNDGHRVDRCSRYVQGAFGRTGCIVQQGYSPDFARRLIHPFSTENARLLPVGQFFLLFRHLPGIAHPHFKNSGIARAQVSTSCFPSSI